MAKRPSVPDNPDSTIVSDDSELPEDLLQTLQPQKTPPKAAHDDEPANDGATAFVRLDQVVAPTRRAAPTAPQSGPADEPANDGSTAFVRLDQVPSLPGDFRKPEAGPPPRRVQDGPPPQSAPRKGLQVTLPDEEPAAAPPRAPRRAA